MSKHLNTKRGRIIAAATTGAVLAGTAGIAYFVASGGGSGSATSGTFTFEPIAATASGDALYPLGSGVSLTMADVMQSGAEDLAEKIDLPVTFNVGDDVQVEIGLETVQQDTTNGPYVDYDHLYVTFCPAGAIAVTSDCTDLVTLTSLAAAPVAPAWNHFGKVIDDGGEQTFTQRAFIFLHDDGSDQVQNAPLAVEFNFVGRTTGRFS